MGAQFSEVVFHITGALDDDAWHQLEESVGGGSGVVSVGHNPDQSHMIMVVYDSESTRASRLLHTFQERGLHAQIVGM